MGHGWSIGSRLAGSLVLFLLSLGLQLVTAVPAFAASLTVSPALGGPAPRFRLSVKASPSLFQSHSVGMARVARI